MYFNDGNIYTSFIMKKILPILIFILFSGCEKREDGIVIEFWTLQLSPVFDNYFYGLINRYESENPEVKIRWIDLPYDAAVQKLLASVAAGNPPDVVNLSSDFLSKFYRLNAFADFTDYFSIDSLKNIFLENALDNCTFNSNVIALPWYLNTYAVLYNKSFFMQAGFNENDIPKTYDEVAEFTKAYKDSTGKFALFWNIGKDSFLPMLLESEGISMTNNEMTKAVFNSREGIEKISKWVELYKNGYLPRETVIQTGTSVIEPFQSGQVAMVLTGPVFLRMVRDNAPGIYEQTGIAPAIKGKQGTHELAAMSLSVLGKSKFKKEAVNFVLYVLNAENQLAFSKLTTTFPSVKEALEDEFFSTTDGSLETEARVIGAKELPAAKRLMMFYRHPQYDKLKDTFEEALQSAFLGRRTVEEALNRAAAQWNKILNE